MEGQLPDEHPPPATRAKAHIRRRGLLQPFSAPTHSHFKASVRSTPKHHHSSATATTLLLLPPLRAATDQYLCMHSTATAATATVAHYLLGLMGSSSLTSGSSRAHARMLSTVVAQMLSRASRVRKAEWGVTMTCRGTRGGGGGGGYNDLGNEEHGREHVGGGRCIPAPPRAPSPVPATLWA